MNTAPRLASRFSDATTVLKLLLIVAAVLLPLGLIGLWASLETAQNARQARLREAELVTEISARTVVEAIDRTSSALRAAAVAVGRDPDSLESCTRGLNALAAIALVEARFAILDRDGSTLCATGDFDPEPAPAPRQTGVQVNLDRLTGQVRILASGGSPVMALAEIPAAALRKVAEPVRSGDNYRVALTQDGAEYVVHDWQDAAPRDTSAISRRIAGNQLSVQSSYEAVPLRTIEIVAIMLPMLMWIAAALVMWVAVNRLLLRPLAGLERAVASHVPGAPRIDLPIARTPALEIRKLGKAFQKSIGEIHRGERELAASMAEQVRLNREIHHRVKNNLQLVASLLSLHARSARTPEVAEAYLSIQRRVDALAIVQRNIFAESDDEAGVPLRTVIAELAAGLRQTAPASSRLTIAVDVAPVRVTQDTALPVAFLITELIELALACSDEPHVILAVERLDANENQAWLKLRSIAFIGCGPVAARYERVMAGLSRQLRGSLNRDESSGLFSIAVPVLVYTVAEPVG